MNICQSCAMPLQKEEEIGTNKDGSLNHEYCIYCFKDGEFLENMTLDEAIAKSAEYAKYAGVMPEQAIEYAKQVYPTLKRWQEN